MEAREEVVARALLTLGSMGVADIFVLNPRSSL
jgi:hypothetical protein